MSRDLLTDDDIARLFADANPVPNRARAASNGSRPDETARSTIMIDVQEATDRTSHQGRHPSRWWLLGAAAAVVAIVVGLAIVARDDDDPVPTHEPTTPAPQPTTPASLAPDDAAPTTVLGSLVDAFNDRDADGLRASLAATADTDAATAVDELIEGLELFDVWDWRWTEPQCTAPSESTVICDLVVQNRLTEYTGTPRYVQLSAATTDGLITRLSIVEDFDEYSSRVFEPFFTYVAATDPDDALAMWNDILGLGAAVEISPAERAELFDRYLTEYTAEPDPPTPPHRVFLTAHGLNASDRPDVAAMFAPDATIGGTWADTPADYVDSLDVLAAWEFVWVVDSCLTPTIVPDRSRITCTTRPTTMFEAIGLELGQHTIGFDMVADGIASFSAWNIAAATDEALDPFYRWIADRYPDDAAVLLDTTDDRTSAVMTRENAQRFGELADQYVDELADGSG